MKRRDHEAVGARFQVCSQAAVVAEQQDATPLRRQSSGALHGDQRFPRACSTGDTHSRKRAQNLEDVELLLGEPYERCAVLDDRGGKRRRQRHPWREQLHKLGDNSGRKRRAGTDGGVEHAFHRLVGPLQAGAVDDASTRQLRPKPVGRLGIREHHTLTKRGHHRARPEIVLQRVHRALHLRTW